MAREGSSARATPPAVREPAATSCPGAVSHRATVKTRPETVSSVPRRACELEESSSTVPSTMTVAER